MNPCRSQVADASRRWAKHSSCGTSCPNKASSTLSATAGLRCSTMCNASAQEAQYDAAAQRVADLKPKPPMRVGIGMLNVAFRSRELSVPQMPSSCNRLDKAGGRVRNAWLALGLALCNRTCQAHCKSGMSGIASHSLDCNFSATNGTLPIGVPNTMTPLGCQASSPRLSTSSGGDSALIPDFCLAMVGPYACYPEQACGQGIVDVLHTAGLAQSIDILQECTQLFSRFQRGRNFFQRCLDANGEQEWHQGVSLLPAFNLGHCVSHNCNWMVSRLRAGRTVG